MILHVDMDAFYASVEERENPSLKGLPVVVGGAADSRGVVAAANYVARNFGVFSAMPMSEAVRKCPDLVIVKPNFTLYHAVSLEIREIFRRYTPVIEPLSLDEAFLDTSGSARLHGSAEIIGQKIKTDIRNDLSLVASVGVAPNKFLAKLASDHNKPDGFTVIEEDAIEEFLDPLPVNKIWGVGKTSRQKLHQLGIYTVADLKEESSESLEKLFGKQGVHLWKLARGKDDRIVTPSSEAKSISQETTFARDIDNLTDLEAVAISLTEAVGFRIREAKLSAQTVQLKLRYNDFSTVTRSQTLSRSTDATDRIWQSAKVLLGKAWKGRQAPVRLIGVGVSNFKGDAIQMDFIENMGTDSGAGTRPAQIDRISDDIRARFGNQSIKRGKSVRRGRIEQSSNN